MKRAIALVAVAALAVAGVAVAGSLNGTWFGKLPSVQGPHVPAQERIPLSAFPTVKLVVTPASIVATFHGRTLAAHDSPTATSTCSMRFRFLKVEDGWRYYLTHERSRLVGSSTGGMPDLSPCVAPPDPDAYLRLRPAGPRLKVEYTYGWRPDREPFGAAARAYLHR